jgi:hypothetical protein
MKRSFTIIITVLLTATSLAQSPQKMSYQAVIRNSSNALVTSSPVGMRVSILQGSSTGTEVYREIYNPNPLTNANGLVTIEIGGGIPLTGTFAAIDWSAGTYFIKTETDPSGGTGYTITGTSQLLSVPYAFYAKTVASYPETDPVFATWNKSAGINITATQVSDFQTNVTNNTAMLANTSKVTNANHTGDATGATALTVARINGTSLAGLATGILKNTTSTGVPSIAVAGTDYLTPTGSAELLTNFPLLNQNTTGNAATVTTNANLTGMVTSIGNVTKVVTNANLTGEVTSEKNTTTVTNSAVTGKVLTGFRSGFGAVTATDNILQAIQKLYGNNPAHYIGESYGGGIVFYVYDNGQHGLIVATADQSTGVKWHAGTNYTYTMAKADGVGAGKVNTAIIIAKQGYGDGTTYAARICTEYQVTDGGVTYGDWYLPSKFELNLLYLQKNVVGGFPFNAYWSSTEEDEGYVYIQVFGTGDQFGTFKGYNESVRAIRAF